MRVPAATPRVSPSTSSDGPGSGRVSASSVSRRAETGRTDRGGSGRTAMPWPTWPPEPFPGPTEMSPMRPAPVRVLTTKVRTPPVQGAAGVAVARADAPTQGVAPGSAAGATDGRPAGADDRRVVPDVAPERTEPARVRRGGESPHGIRWIVIAVVLLSVAVGGVLATRLASDPADPVATSAPVASTVPATTVAPTTVATTVAPTTTVAAVPNALGIVVGAPADGASARPEERFAAHLGVDDTAATPASPASVYARWWKLFVGRDAPMVASPNGFATDADGQSVELTGFVAGGDGKVADLVECVTVGVARPTCNRLSNVVGLDQSTSVVGQSANVTFRRFAELRLLRDRVIRMVTMTPVQPMTAAASAAGDVRFDDGVLAVALPSTAVPATIDVALTYADGTTETVTITV